MVKRVGILTSGSDCPGLNAVLRAVVRAGISAHHVECVGILRGWRGLMDGLTTPLTLESINGILPRGGTILRTSRTNPFVAPEGPRQIMDNVKRFNLDGVIVAGGADTFTVACRLYKEHAFRVVGIPATIDNDVEGTEYSFGFDSTVNIATEAIDRIHTTAESHDRVMIVEVMGRLSGWIAVCAGIAGGADIILIPERPFTLQEVSDAILRRHDRGNDFSIVVVAEGARIKDRTENDGVYVTAESAPDEFGQVAAGRSRFGHRKGNREADRLRDARHGARAHPAGRDADGVRPRPGQAVRRGGDGAGDEGEFREDGRAPGEPRRGRAPGGARRQTQDRPRRILHRRKSPVRLNETALPRWKSRNAPATRDAAGGISWLFPAQKDIFPNATGSYFGSFTPYWWTGIANESWTSRVR